MNEDRIKALKQLLDIKEDDDCITISGHDDQILLIGKQEYLVVTDSEADKKWDEDLENYIKDIILPEIPEKLRYYFDEDKWINDAKMDGRGHSLNHYDGNENTEEVDGETYYIYRQN